MNKDPYLYFKYNKGLGDFVASVLHSRFLGWLTKLITKKDKPCSICSKRAEALNILFPIPFWKLFFKNSLDMTESLKNDLLAAGYHAEISPDYKNISSMKVEATQDIQTNEFIPFIPETTDPKLANYIFLSSNDQEIDHILIRTQIYKSKS